MWLSMSSGAMHIETIYRPYKDKRYACHLLRRARREDGKVKKETLANLSDLPEAAIDALRRILKGESVVAVGDALAIERSRPHGHVVAVLGTMKRLGIERLLASQPSRQRDLCMAMIAARVLEPKSKSATVRGFRPDTLRSTLGEALHVERADEDALYEAMDWLLARQERIEASLAKKHLSEGAMVLYDLTSTYIEGRTCPLAKLGYSRDGKTGKRQIEFGLMTDGEGRPIAVEVFAGNTADPNTVYTQVNKLRERFKLERVVLVGDRGMLTQARIDEDLRPHQGLDWITSLRAPAIAELRESGALQLSLFDTRDLAEITDPAYPGERLVVCKNPLLAQERARKRSELLAATEREFEKVVRATQRTRDPLRGAAKIGVRVGKVLGKFKMAKHFDLQIAEGSFSFARNEARIADEAALDGIYVVRTSVGVDRLSAEDVVRRYKSLSDVERAFRSFKTVDLKVRPIYHAKEQRVRAHVLLCMLAYYVEWHMRRDLAPILFDDHEPDAAEAKRESIVQPAERSDAALKKAATKRTADGLPVQSFRDLLADLATLALNRVRTPSGATFDMLTEPTQLQRKAFELLQITPAP
jgi:transposase